MQDKLLTGTIVAASAVALVDIQTVMGIVLMAVQLGLIIWKAVAKYRQSKSDKEKMQAILDAQQEVDALEKSKKGDDK